MSENGQDRMGQQEQAMPEEFHRFREALKKGPREQDTLDEKIAMWTYMLEAWREIFGNSAYEKQALYLLIPLLRNCSVFYFHRYEEQGKREDLHQSIDLIQEVLHHTKDGTPDIFSDLDHLGLVLGLRYNLTRSLEDLEATFSNWQRALTNATDASGRAKYCYFLGQAYKERYRLLKSEDDLRSSIQYLERSVRLETSAKRCDPLNLLAFMLRERYTLTEDIYDLRDAEQAWEEAVDLLPWEDPTMPDMLANIAAIQARIFAITQQQEDIEDDIAYWQNVLEQMPDELAFKANGYNFAGYCQTMRFEFTQDLQDLNEAVQLQERAIELAPTQSPGRNSYLHNLQNILMTRYEAIHDEADLKRTQRIESEMGEL